MKSATVTRSPSFKPRVVTAGVPSRRPLVTLGAGSFKIAFLLVMMPADWSACSAAAPVKSALRAKIHQHQVIVRTAALQAITLLLNADAEIWHS